jgi:hypothetical protein
MGLFGQTKPSEGAAPANQQQQQPAEQKKSSFGSFLTSKPAPPPTDLSGINKDLTLMSRRIRINEERNMNIRKKIQVIEHNMLLSQKRMLSEIRYINDEITDLKRQIEDLKGSLSVMGREVSLAAKKEDVQVLEKYVNMWEPMNFVTRQEIDRILTEKLKKHDETQE